MQNKYCKNPIGMVIYRCRKDGHYHIFPSPKIHSIMAI